MRPCIVSPRDGIAAPFHVVWPSYQLAVTLGGAVFVLMLDVPLT
jgi:hypothetical protein